MNDFIIGYDISFDKSFIKPNEDKNYIFFTDESACKQCISKELFELGKIIKVKINRDDIVKEYEDRVVCKDYLIA